MFSCSKHKAFLCSCSMLTLTGFLCAAETGEVTGCSSFLAGPGLDWKSRGSLSEQTHRSGEVSAQSTCAAEKTRWFWRGSTGKSLNQRLLLASFLLLLLHIQKKLSLFWVMLLSSIIWSCPGSCLQGLEVNVHTAERGSGRLKIRKSPHWVDKRSQAHEKLQQLTGK